MDEEEFEHEELVLILQEKYTTTLRLSLNNLHAEVSTLQTANNDPSN